MNTKPARFLGQEMDEVLSDLLPDSSLGVKGEGETSELSPQTLRAALEATFAHNQRLKDYIVGLVNSMPLGALLLRSDGRILASNQQARSFMAESDWRTPKAKVQDLWGQLGWPTVPFAHWEWEEGWLTCWDCPLDTPASSAPLRMRFLDNQTSAQEGKRQDRLAAIGEMTGRLAHDIRNPLASIEWFATLLKRSDSITQESRQLIHYLGQSVQTLKGMMDNLLSFSHAYSFQPQSIALEPILAEMKFEMDHLTQKKDLTIQWKLDEGLGQVVVDETLFRQAVQNILLNAIQASNRGDNIFIRGFSESNAGSKKQEHSHSNGFVLYVQDHGCGMTQEEVTKAFHPFYSTRKGGTGLGLSIVKHIIQIHDGLIDLKSEKSQGTVVRLFFPQKRSEA